MQNILTGIYAAYDANTALEAALSGGLHFERAPQGTDMPYATYLLVSGRPDYHFNGYFEMTEIQFDIYAETNAARQTAYDALTAVYDDARITATGYVAIIMERTLHMMLRDGDQDQYFRAIVSYECSHEKAA